MTLSDFMDANNITPESAAARLGRDRTLIGRYRKREVTPSPEIIAEIVEWSSGVVTPRELLALRDRERAA